MKKKSVWLINQYLCTPELNGDQHRHSHLSEEWIKKGYDVTLITSSFSHVPYRENDFKGLFKVNNGLIRTLLIKGNKYKETQGISRVLSWLIFSFLLFFIPTKKIPKPDIIIVSSNSLLPILNVCFYFKLKYRKVKFILEIRDIWPMSLIELGKYSPKNIFIKFLAWVEKIGYTRADYIVSTLIDTDKHIKSVLKNKKFNYAWITNGYGVNNEKENLPVSLINKIPKDKFVIGYAGSLGIANAMEFIIEAVKELKDENVVLCILGSGNELQNLKSRSSGYNNIVFFDKIPKNQVSSFLSYCDLLYFSFRNLKIYSYGMSANKTFDYMFAEKPILLSAPTVSNIIELANCGSVIPAENKDLIKKEILKYKNTDKQILNQLGKNGKTYLLNHFTYSILAKKYIDVFEKLLK